MRSNELTGKISKNKNIQRLRRVVLITLVWVQLGHAGVFQFITEADEINVITHPTGYNGSGEELEVSVGISPRSPHAEEMEIAVQNAINTWNQLIPTTGNIRVDEMLVPRQQFDFESVALHELGHCIGLGHPNLATESGALGDDKNYTNAIPGANGRFDLNSGADGVIGSEDDLRGDDINLHWFNMANNNPFELSEIVDQTTYSREQGDLPSGHQFATNGDRSVSFLLGFENTESVMQQGIEAGESKRTLAADDVATLRLAMSGFDGREGTSDDYSLTLQYVGQTENADIVLSFDNRSVFAACRITGEFLNDKHIVVREGRISFNTGFAWFFNPVLALPASQQPVVSILANGQSDDSVVLQSGDRLSLVVGLEPGVMNGEEADYWVRAVTPLGDYWLSGRLQFVRSGTPVRAHGGPMLAFSGLTILDSVTTGFPAGTYTITFAVDNNRDQIFDETYRNSVTFTVLP